MQIQEKLQKSHGLGSIPKVHHGALSDLRVLCFWNADDKGYSAHPNTESICAHLGGVTHPLKAQVKVEVSSLHLFHPLLILVEFARLIKKFLKMFMGKVWCFLFNRKISQ